MLGRNNKSKMVKVFFQKAFWIIRILREITFSITKSLFEIFFNALKTAIKGFPAVGFYIIYKITFDDFKIDYFQTIYLLTPLAILIGFSSLLYSRARAVNDSEQQHKSLLAADSVFRGSIFYSLALTWGFAVSAVYLAIIKDGYSFPNFLFELLYFPSLLAVIKAYADLFDGLSSLWKHIKAH